MRSLWFISILLILATGCKSVEPSDLIRQRLVGGDKIRDVVQNPLTGLFMSPGSSLFCKASLDIKTHHLTGLLLIKRMDTVVSPQTGRGVYRIVFANEIGMTFFDLEMKTDSFKVISCFEALNKKALMRILETDFRLLTGLDPVKHEETFRQSVTNYLVFYGKAGKYKTWQTCSPSGDTLYAAAANSTITDPVIISYFNYIDGVPTKIDIVNLVIGMKLSLRILKR